MSDPALAVSALGARRGALETRENPARHTDYLVRLVGALGMDGAGVTLALCYVPDRVLLAPEAFATYLTALGAESWDGIEEIGAAALADLESELVPRYLRITVGSARRVAGGAETDHAAVFEGRQPGWKNDAILAPRD